MKSRLMCHLSHCPPQVQGHLVGGMSVYGYDLMCRWGLVYIIVLRDWVTCVGMRSEFV